jgi:hypothetical protein
VRALANSFYRVAITAWVGGLWVIGYLAAPTLFYRLTDHMLAGSLAGTMFSALAWTGIVCASYLLLFLFLRHGLRVFSLAVFWLVLLMLGVTLAGLFGIQPIVTRLALESWPRGIMESTVHDRFAMWHGVSSALYVLQSLLGLALLLVQDQGRR